MDRGCHLDIGSGKTFRHGSVSYTHLDVYKRQVMYRLETYIFPAIGKTHIAKLETRDVMEVVKPLEQRGNYETSRRVLQIISQVFRYAVITGRAKHNVAADLRGALRPRKTVHRAAVCLLYTSRCV